MLLVIALYTFRFEWTKTRVVLPNKIVRRTFLFLLIIFPTSRTPDICSFVGDVHRQDKWHVAATNSQGVCKYFILKESSQWSETAHPIEIHFQDFFDF